MFARCVHLVNHCFQMSETEILTHWLQVVEHFCIMLEQAEKWLVELHSLQGLYMISAFLKL